MRVLGWVFRVLNKKINIRSTNLISGILLITIGTLIYLGYLYALNRYARTTGFQKWIFGLEEKLVNTF